MFGFAMIQLVHSRAACVRGGYPGKPMPYNLALEEAWCQQAAPCTLVGGYWERAEYAGEGSIGGVAYQPWVYQQLIDTVRYCIVGSTATGTGADLTSEREPLV